MIIVITIIKERKHNKGRKINMKVVNASFYFLSDIQALNSNEVGNQNLT